VISSPLNVAGLLFRTEQADCTIPTLKFTLGKPLSQEVDGDHGNVIVPLVSDFKEAG
jgi:hypothetical protein